MTQRTQLVIYDYGTDRRTADDFGGEVIGTGIARSALAGGGLEVAPRRWRRDAFHLARQASGFYPTTPKTIRQHLRGGTLVHDWAAIELFYSAPTGTTVRVRLHDGDDAYYWTGAAWAVAGPGNWNTPADLEAHFSTLDAAAFSRVTVEWELSSSDKRTTPSVYGATAAARLVFGAHSGATAADTGSDGWLDDLVIRVILPWLATSARPERTDESTTLAAETSVLSFADLEGTSYLVAGVLSVCNLITDPQMRAPLAGTWDASARTFTLATPLPAGSKWVARLTYEPAVHYAPDRHLVTARLPHIVIERLGPVRRGGGLGQVFVRNAARTSALATEGPRHIEFTATILCQADGPVPAFELTEAIDRALAGGEGLCLVSAQTGMRVTVVRDSEEQPQRPDAARFGLTVRSEHYRGVEVALPLIQSVDDVLITIGDDSLVTADA
ncbi:MAG: hypothetical protein AB7U23_13210 [Dehalococcoidia bacterium]